MKQFRLMVVMSLKIHFIVKQNFITYFQLKGLQHEFDPLQIEFDPLQIGFNPLQIGFNHPQIGFIPLQAGFTPLQVEFDTLQFRFSPQHACEVIKHGRLRVLPVM
jgi:hypothetical protein